MSNESDDTWGRNVGMALLGMILISAVLLFFMGAFHKPVSPSQPFGAQQGREWIQSLKEKATADQVGPAERQVRADWNEREKREALTRQYDGR